jgi:hypothetical protein
MQQIIVKFYYFVVQTLLNMFLAIQCPSSGARQTAIAASGFRMNVEVDVYSAVVGSLVGRHWGDTVSPLMNQPQLRTHPPPHSYGNQKVATTGFSVLWVA